MTKEQTLTKEKQEWEEELLEKWADIEHQRWAKWQKYMHSKLVNVDGNTDILGLPKEFYDHWERQIATDYKDLSEKEKESDREQVQPYIEDIKTLLQKQKEKALEIANIKFNEIPTDEYGKENVIIGAINATIQDVIKNIKEKL